MLQSSEESQSQQKHQSKNNAERNFTQICKTIWRIKPHTRTEITSCRCKKTIEDLCEIPERDDKYDNDDDTDCDYEVEGNVKSAEKLNET